MDRRKNEMKENSINQNGNSNSNKTNGNSISINASSTSNLNGSQSNHLSSEDLSKHEMFLQAFEKPTQIYRYLRTRHSISPTFLHRTLFYMKHRMSRDHSKRKTFKVDSILDKLMEKKLNEIKKNGKFGNLLIQFTGIQDKSIDIKSVVNITVCILKINAKNKLESVASNEIVIGECKFNSLSIDSSHSSSKLLIPKENFNSNAKHILVFKVMISKSNYNNSNGDFVLDELNGKDEIQPKKRKLSLEPRKYRAELLILGKNQECLLKDGEYNVALNDCNSSNLEFKQESIQDRFKKIVFWESASQINSSLKDITQEPCVSFYLNWSTDLTDNMSQPIKPYLVKNQVQPLKQIEPPNTENKFFSNKNSNKKFSTNSVHNSSNGFNNKETNGSLTRNNNSKVVYRFIYNNQTLQQTKASNDFKCPWCGVYCLQIFSLKHHLKFCHNRLNFSFSLDGKGYKIDVTINEVFDGSYCGNPQQDLLNFSSRSFGPLQRIPVTHILVNLKGKARQILIDFLDNETMDIDLIKPHVYGHNRLYYHSGTCQPIKPHELDKDSEDEIDPEWMKIKTQLMIDEFTDVNEGEKEVMKLWNLHMMKYNFVGGCHVPLACEIFVKENWKAIIEQNIYMNFILHLNNLFDYGLLSSSNLRMIVKKFNEIKKNYLLAKTE